MTPIATTSIPATMTSREIAELVEQRHDNVKRTIETLGAKGVIALPQIEEVPSYGPGPKTVGVYFLGKRDSLIVVAQLCPEFTARIIDRWQELEQRGAFAIPTTLSGALMLAAQQAERIEHQQALIAQQQPAVEFVGRFVQASGLKGFREVCKLLKANEARFREFVLAKKIMYRLGGTLTAHQSHIDAGRFEVRAGIAEATDHAFTTTKFTAKGIDWIAGEWARWQLHEAVEVEVAHD